MTEQRKKENQEEAKTYLKDENHSKEISKLIDDTLKSGHKIWLGSDWHLWIKDRNNPRKCNKRINFDQIINEVNKADPDDLLIFMGDLVDGEFKNKEELKATIKDIGPKNKIMVRGNNDLFDTNFYRSCGFKYVVYRFIWNDIVFSHPPIEHNHKMNIHGHLHFNYKDRKRKQSYWVPYNNHVCVFDENGKLQELKDVMKSLNEYKKHIRVDEKRVEEMRDKCAKGIFEQALISYIYDYTDPYGFDE